MRYGTRREDSIMENGFIKGSLLSDTQVTPHQDRPQSFVGHISEAWRLFYAFGGVSLAVGLRAVEAALDDVRLQPLYVSALFSKPVPCGPVRIDVEPLSKSGSVFQAVSRLYADGETVPNVHLHATFARPIPGKRTLGEARFPEGIRFPSEALPNGPSPVDLFPNTHQFELRWAHEFCNRPGAPPPPAPITDEPAQASSWIRYHEPPVRPDGLLDPITFPAPADCMAAALFRGLGTDAEPFFPATVAMDIQFFGTTRHSWLLQHARVWRLEDGYACGVLELWDEDRNLLAVSTQRRICKGLPPPRQG
jgi:hypothetical protein